MRAKRRAGAFVPWVLVVVLVGIAVGCAGRRPPVLAPGAPAFGLYHGRLEDERGARRFRVLLFAAAPDRLHGEVLSPLGSTELVLDGGAGRLSVTAVRRGVSWVGAADPETLDRVLGIRMSLEELVGALLGVPIDRPDLQIARLEAPDGALARRLEITSSARRLTLDLRRLRPLPAGAQVGTGEPPPNTVRRPLDDLDLEEEERGLAG